MIKLYSDFEEQYLGYTSDRTNIGMHGLVFLVYISYA